MFFFCFFFSFCISNVQKIMELQAPTSQIPSQVERSIISFLLFFLRSCSHNVEFPLKTFHFVGFPYRVALSCLPSDDFYTFGFQRHFLAASLCIILTLALALLTYRRSVPHFSFTMARCCTVHTRSLTCNLQQLLSLCSSQFELLSFCRSYQGMKVLFFFSITMSDRLKHRRCQVPKEESRFSAGRVIRKFALSCTSVVHWISSDEMCNCFGRMCEREKEQ